MVKATVERKDAAWREVLEARVEIAKDLFRDLQGRRRKVKMKRGHWAQERKIMRTGGYWWMIG